MKKLVIVCLAALAAGCGDSGGASGLVPVPSDSDVTTGGAGDTGVCVRQCDGLQCGGDGCGGVCGACAADEFCNKGICALVDPGCQPNCIDKQCGKDGCGGDCGSCGAGAVCDAGLCVGCTPDCAGKQCGDDGCAGSCGTCPVGTQCDHLGQCLGCVADCQGKQCGDDGCGGDCGPCAADLVCDGNWQCVGECIPDCLGKQCGPNGCGAGCGVCGDTELCTADGICVAQGTPCDDSIVVDIFPYSVTGDTTDEADGFAFAIDDCPSLSAATGDSAPDRVYSFTAPDPGAYTITLTPDGFDAALVVVADCQNAAATCVAASAVSGSGPQSLDVTLGQYDQISIVIDGADADAAGSYTLEIHGAGCTPACVGKVCGPDGCGGTCGVCGDAEQCTGTGQCVGVLGGCPAAQTIPAVPFETSGDTSGADEVLEYGAGACTGETSGWGGGAPEEVYAFTPTVAGTYTATLTADYDSNLYVVADCGDVDGSCLGAHEEVGTGKTETVTFDREAGQTVWIVVDGWGGGAAGAYDLSLVEGGCVPACADKECGDDGCDGTCGACGAQESCEAGICVGDEPPPTEACCEAAEGPGCASATCQQCVCDLDEWCCTNKWDNLCAAAATDAEKCATECGCDAPPPEAACCEETEDPGCGASATCEACVCGQDSYCCDNKWDSLCVGAAADAEKCGAECGCSDCAADCTNKSCGDDGCGGTCGTCAQGEVCNPDSVCVDASGDLCDDGNECTFDIPIPTLGCQNVPVGGPGCSADITITSPKRGAMLEGPAGVTVTGSVDTPGGTLKSLTVNGKTVTVGPTGAFSTPLSPKVGLNTLEVRASTTLGGEAVAVRAFTWADAYHGIAATVNAGTSLFASKTVWDDDDTSDVDDLATVVTLVLEGIDVASVIPNPLGSYKVAWCTYTIHVQSFSLGDVDVDLTPVDGALRAIVVYPDLYTVLKAEGDGFGCIDATPTVTADYLQVSLDLSVQSAANGQVTVTMANETATVSNLDIKLSGVAGFLFNWIFNFFEDDVASNIESMVVQQLGQFPAALSQAIEQIAVDQAIQIPGVLGPPTTLQLFAELQGADIDESGARFDVGATLSPLAKITPWSAPGSVLRKGCGAGSDGFSFPKSGQIEFAIADDLANQALFSLWWGGAFEGPAPADLLGGVDLEEYQVAIDSVDVSFMLPPVLSDCDPGKGLVLGLGDIRVVAVVELFGVETVTLTAHASARVKVSAVVQTGAAGKEVGLKLGSTVFMGVELDPLSGEMAPVKPALEFLILEHLIPPLLEDLTGGVLAAIPVPEIPLDGFSAAIPPGTSVSLDLQQVIRTGGHTVLSGDAQ